MKYSLHDTVLNKIAFDRSGITLHFKNGVYLLDNDGRETELSGPCRIAVTINKFNSMNKYEHITVTKTAKSKIDEIDIERFIKMLDENSFRIDSDYYSFFGSSILLKGYIGKYAIEFIITEIEKAEYLFDN